MKKTNNISLGKCVFCVEEDAVAKLQQYINTLEGHYMKEEGGSEIMNDIEVRLAELFTEYLSANKREYVIMDDVLNAIKVMGSPNDIIDDEIKEEPKKATSRKLYRDVDQKVIGGVAAGLAQWMNIPVAAVRLIFLLLFFFAGGAVLIYIICWIVIPQAITPAQKLEMQGESVNINNIAKKAMESIQKNNTGKTLGQIFNALFKIISVFVLIVASIIAVAITVIAVIQAFSPANTFLPMITLCESGAAIVILANISLYLIAVMPAVLLIWLCCHILFKNWQMRMTAPICMFIVWILAITTFLIIILTQHPAWMHHGMTINL